MSEHALQNTIRNALAGLCILFRVNVGRAWQGVEQRMPNGDLLLRNPRRFNSGVPPGFSDLFGVVPVVITQDMVGQTIGQALFGEVKTSTGTLSDIQAAFLQAMNNQGARAGVWRSPEDALAMVRGEERRN